MLTNGKCEEAAQSLPNFKVKTVTEYGLTASTPTASIALTRNDLVYFVIGGITIPTLACRPAGTEFIGTASLYAKCFEKLHGLSMPEQVRCPDVSLEVEQLLEVAQCYDKRGDAKRAREQRELLIDENAFGGCVSEKHQQYISRLLELGN